MDTTKYMPRILTGVKSGVWDTERVQAAMLATIANELAELNDTYHKLWRHFSGYKEHGSDPDSLVKGAELEH